MHCQNCKKEVTIAQLRGKLAKWCVLCAPKGAMPDKDVLAALGPKSEPKPKKSEKAPVVAYPTTLTELSSMKKGDLVGLASSLGVDTDGLKDDLIQRIAKKLKIKSKR